MGDHLYFMACHAAEMTRVGRCSDVQQTLSKVRDANACEVELGWSVEVERSVVAAVEGQLVEQGRLHHGNWYEGVIDQEEAEGLVDAGRRAVFAPTHIESRQLKYLFIEAIELVDKAKDDAVARSAYEEAMRHLDDFEGRAVAEHHVELSKRLRSELHQAGVVRAQRRPDADPVE